MHIEYVGRQKPHRERLYGTKTVFAGPGDVQEMDDDIGRKMINKHPDQYAEAGQEPVAAPAPTGQDPNAAGDQPPVSDVEPGQIVINGETLNIKDVSSDVLIEIAKKAYDKKIPVRTAKPEVVEIVTGLVAEYGQPKE